jgi:epoxide hydrolase 4
LADQSGAGIGATAPANSQYGSISSPLRFARCATSGVHLNVAEAGPPAGSPVILLHGFPEFWYGWRHQIDALAEAGYRVIVPDQRGYHLSDRPRGVAAYDLDELAQDIIGLADTLGLARFAVVGHDWGGTVAWWIASRAPERLSRFAVLAAPHPAVWMDAIRNDPSQRKRSGYVQAFRLPWLPEFLIGRRNFKALADALSESRRPEACTPVDLDHYRAAWAQPGALTAMVNYYRAILAKSLTVPGTGSITVPGLVIWGNHDKFGIKDLAERSVALCAQASALYLDTSHWVQHDAPDEVNAALLAFLGGRSG